MAIKATTCFDLLGFFVSLFWLDILFCTVMLLLGWFYIIIFQKDKSTEMILISKVEVLNKNHYN